MIHPSYYELMEKMNEVDKSEGVPVITSRYFVVLAASKRARQLIDGAEPKVTIKSPKLLSVAVEEFYEGEVKIVKDENGTEGETDAQVFEETPQQDMHADAEEI